MLINLLSHPPSAQSSPPFSLPQSTEERVCVSPYGAALNSVEELSATQQSCSPYLSLSLSLSPLLHSVYRPSKSVCGERVPSIIPQERGRDGESKGKKQRE